MTDFIIDVEGIGPQPFTSLHSEYALAAMEAFGVLGLSYPCELKIWVPGLMPHYGPYRYRIGNFVDSSGREYIAPAVQNISQ